jgi:hypothetical protein
MDLQPTIVVNEAELSELVHEDADTWPGRPNHLREHRLADFRGDGLRRSLFAKIRQQQKGASQSLFTRIEQMVSKVRLSATVAGQHGNCLSGDSRGGVWHRMAVNLLSRRAS